MEKLTTIDKICIEKRKQGLKYADWQKERYPIKADLPKRRGEYYGRR